jgi:hypothetical protein
MDRGEERSGRLRQVGKRAGVAPFDWLEQDGLLHPDVSFP